MPLLYQKSKIYMILPKPLDSEIIVLRTEMYVKKNEGLNPAHRLIQGTKNISHKQRFKISC